MKKNNNILYKKQYRYKRKHSYQFLTKKTTEESLLINQKQEILTKNSEYNKDITKKQNKPIETQKTNNQSNNLNKKSFFSKLLFWRKNKKFDFDKFYENVQYKELSDGTKLKIAAEIKDIHLSFTNPAVPGQKNKVLRGPSIEIYEGKVHAIIGESGSGKSVITSLLYGLTGDNAVIDSGTVKLYNNNVEKFTFKDWEKSKYRGKIVSAVFQNPMSTLNPTMKVGNQIIEGMLLNKVVKNKKEAYSRALEFLKLTKINDPEAVMKLYPHEMSGGMIQRVVIAAIVALEPKILVMDEPTTALDPTVQALVLDIIKELQEKLKLSIVFITHDLGVVASISDYISIMYAGQIIEEGTREEILHHPQHPYTWGLIMSMPDVNKGSRLATIRGSVPSNLNNIKGDAFAVRNDYALGIDFQEEPDFYQISETHRIKSALLDQNAPKYEPPLLIQKLWKGYLNKDGK
ncbi:ABC transporter ATP-binding protein [Mycoplasmopsis felis]|uniref:ABC transporter ATP-binding protein n=1 Tax=Mycoplasmopsis felis TaxID=33923 RepID=UPI002AFECC37|nr:ABC transporter ATP-binding protein [Mycoplasmopsis felis]WQQ08281.1 ABC transporter ATP-binding protein [Mycoplasmopsis felis]